MFIFLNYFMNYSYIEESESCNTMDLEISFLWLNNRYTMQYNNMPFNGGVSLAN